MVQVVGIVYNKIYNESELITNDTEQYLREYYPNIPVIPVEKINIEKPPLIDFSEIFSNLL